MRPSYAKRVVPVVPEAAFGNAREATGFGPSTYWHERESNTAKILIAQGVPPQVVLQVIRWKRLHPDRHIGALASLMLAGFVRRSR